MRTKTVKNLVPWAGHNFSHKPGDHIDLPEETANARIAAGLAAEPDSAAAARGDATRLFKMVGEREDAVAARDRTIKDLEDFNAALSDEVQAKEALLVASATYVAALIDQLKELGAVPVSPPPAADIDPDAAAGGNKGDGKSPKDAKKK
jgi:hypothetical protein